MHAHPTLSPFLQALAAPPPEEAAALRGMAPPAEPRAAEAFFQALPCAGWVAREICRQRPAASLGVALRSCLEVLIARAGELAAGAPADFEERTLAMLQEALADTYGDLEWNLPAPPPRAAPGAAHSSPVVLVAEDCPVTRFALCAHLQRAGWQAHAVSDGAEVLLLAPVIQPDLVLLDLHLDRLDGLRTAKLLNNSGLTDDPAIVFLTGDEERATVASLFAAGAADFILKPFAAHTALPRLRAQAEIRQLRRQLHTANNQLHKIHLTQWHTLARLSQNLHEPLADLRAQAVQLGDGALGPLNIRQAAAAQEFLRTLDATLAAVDELQDRDAVADDSEAAPHAGRTRAGAPAWIFDTPPGCLPFAASVG